MDSTVRKGIRELFGTQRFFLSIFELTPALLLQELAPDLALQFSRRQQAAFVERTARPLRFRSLQVCPDTFQCKLLDFRTQFWDA